MIRAALTPPLLPRVPRTCRGTAGVCVMPPTVLSGVLSSPEQGGEDAKAREGSKWPWRRRRGAARIAIDDASPDAWLHTRLRSDAKPHCGIAADAIARATADCHHAVAGQTTRRRRLFEEDGRQNTNSSGKWILGGPDERVGTLPRLPVRVAHGTGCQASP